MNNVYETKFKESTVPDIGKWDKIRQELLSMLISDGYPDDMTISFLVAAEEIFANIAMYAFPEGFCKKDILSIEYGTGADDPGEYAMITFRDSGAAFDPTKVSDRKPVDSVRDLKPGGFGIRMVRDKTDRMVYNRKDGMNILSIIKYKPAKEV